MNAINRNTVAFAFILLTTGSVFVDSHVSSVPDQSALPPELNMNDAGVWIARADAAAKLQLTKHQPRIEIYLQKYAADARLGARPTQDCHVLGSLHWGAVPRIQVFATAPGTTESSRSPRCVSMNQSLPRWTRRTGRSRRLLA